MMWNERTLTGWGRTAHATMEVGRPERPRDLSALLADTNGTSVIVHGAGRSYGDAALNAGGRAILTERLSRLLSFNEKTGRLVCEAGVTFADLMDVFLPRGFCVPVTPGTAFATIGGAVATDVHGKNHDRAGSFGDHVEWIELVTAKGQTVRVSPKAKPALFAATIGGMGLTGIITTVCFRMVRVPSASMALKERRIADLDAFFAAFEEVRADADYSVGWIDALAKGKQLGRGILETATVAEADPARKPKDRQRRVPIDFPGVALNPVTVGAFNDRYYRRVPVAGRDSVIAADRFFYPLDAVQDWNRIYGKRGFYQFQCVVPDDTARDGIRRALETISAARTASFLAVLKTLGGEGRGMLSFPMRGYTLALDFPRKAGIEALLDQLEGITLDHGGRIYLAKDAVLSPEGFARMYPRSDVFREILSEVDPKGRFQSDMSRRLNLKGGRS